MTNVRRVFISHASKDDDFVKTLRLALEAHRVPVWVDSRNLRGGAKLAPEISDAIERAEHFIVVLSPNTISSSWVRREIQKALEVEKQRADDGYRLIPLVLPGSEATAVAEWCGQDRLGIRVELAPGGLTEALADILAALANPLREDRIAAPATSAPPVSELLLKLTEPFFQSGNGSRRAAAAATLIYKPADEAEGAFESGQFNFMAPLGSIETD